MKKENQQRQTCFDWLQLIITFSIPVVLAVYTVLHDNRAVEIASHNRAQDLEISDNQHKDAVLRDCQKTISKLIEKYGIQLNRTQSASLVARFAVISAIDQLDQCRRSFLIHLLYDARLITYQPPDYRPAISLQSANLNDINLINLSKTKTLEYVSFIGASLTRANFREMNIHGVKFDRTKIQYADFSLTSNGWGCDSIDCEKYSKQKLCFRYANLTFASFSRAVYDTVLFDNAYMFKVNFEWSACTYCSYKVADLSYADMRHVDIEQSSFSVAKLVGTNLEDATIGSAVDFDYAIMRYVQAKRISIENCQFINTDLRDAVFDYANIRNTTFKESFMMKFSMQFGRVIGGDFSRANLFASNFQSIRCEQCVFNNTNLTNVNLLNAVFIESDFRNCHLSDKQLKQATFLNNTLF